MKPFGVGRMTPKWRRRLEIVLAVVVGLVGVAGALAIIESYDRTHPHCANCGRRFRA